VYYFFFAVSAIIVVFVVVVAARVMSQLKIHEGVSPRVNEMQLSSRDATR